MMYRFLFLFGLGVTSLASMALAQTVTSHSMLTGNSGGLQSNQANQHWLTVGENAAGLLSGNAHSGFYSAPVPAIPQLEITNVLPDTIRLTWQSIPAATYYQIVETDNPYGSTMTDSAYVVAPDTNQTIVRPISPDGYRYYRVKSGN